MENFHEKILEMLYGLDISVEEYLEREEVQIALKEMEQSGNFPIEE